jgi:hypothetical protein
MARKPAGYWIDPKSTNLVLIMAHDGEDPGPAIAAFSAAHQVDPSTIFATPPPPPYAGIEVQLDRHLPPKGAIAPRKVAFPGQGAMTAHQGAVDFFNPKAPEAPSSSPAAPPSTPSLPAPTDYSTMMPPKR